MVILNQLVLYIKKKLHHLMLTNLTTLFFKYKKMIDSNDNFVIGHTIWYQNIKKDVWKHRLAQSFRVQINILYIIMS